MAWRKVIWLCWAIWNHIQWPSDPGLAVSTRPLNLSVTAAGKTLQSRKPTRISVPFPSLTRKFSYIPFCSSPCFDLAPLSVVISLFYTQSHSSSLSFTTWYPRLILYFLVSALKFAISPKKPSSFCWRMVFRNQDLVALMQNKQAANQPKWKRREKSSLQ